MGWELVASIITKAAATEKLQNDDYSQKFETICANIYFFLFWYSASVQKNTYSNYTKYQDISSFCINNHH